MNNWPTPEKLECVGGPYDGKKMHYVGPELKVPLRDEPRVYWAPPGDEIGLQYREPRVGLYRELTPLQPGARHVGEPIYWWEGE